MNYPRWLFFSFALNAAGAAAELPEIKFRAQTIDAAIQIGYGLAIADVDGDGRDECVGGCHYAAVIP